MISTMVNPEKMRELLVNRTISRPKHGIKISTLNAYSTIAIEDDVVNSQMYVLV